ncbi:MAG: tRNA guanosine(15) transglycosylase TgtA [Candidatus Bathyarchaeota archaeon]|jgi:7-cyano-7-deazaguanine tRNA-ribosyltransferase
MSFELRDRDLMGRIGRLKTKSGTVETPAFMPVINPLRQSIPPREMLEEYSCEIVITNSYIIMKNFGGDPGLDVHRLLDYDGVVTTDSGAYQLLVYGEVETDPEEIIKFQQGIGSDIAVILDIPTGWNEPRSRVEYTVEETLHRARAALPLIEGDETLWIGPVQGGAYLDLVERSAREVGEMPYQIHALGSPTEVMENYRFPVLVDMIMAAKLNLPPERPLHLFGAGHPMMFALAVALGCDLFDSAAYALYANNERYLTPLGTLRLPELRYLPCSCPVCSQHTARELRGMLKGQRRRLLTEHNLWVTMAEMRRVKQAIVEGTLWDLVEARSRAHPAMTSALRRLHVYRDEIERYSPGYKGRGAFFFSHDTTAKPEVTRHVRQLRRSHGELETGRVLLLASAPGWRPYSKSRPFRGLVEAIEEGLGAVKGRIQICFYDAPFGVVPLELAETYPLSQFEIAEPLDWETLELAAELVATYVEESGFREVLIVAGFEEIDHVVRSRFEEMEEKAGKGIHILSSESPWSEETRERVVSALKKIMRG